RHARRQDVGVGDSKPRHRAGQSAAWERSALEVRSAKCKVQSEMRALVLGSVFVATFGIMLLADSPPAPTQHQLEQVSARFAPVDIGADVSTLPPNERRVLAKLVEASHLIDAIFLRQVWAGNEATLMRLEADQSPLGRARLNYFLLNKGGWSR